MSWREKGEGQPCQIGLHKSVQRASDHVDVLRHIPASHSWHGGMDAHVLRIATCASARENNRGLRLVRQRVHRHPCARGRLDGTAAEGGSSA